MPFFFIYTPVVKNMSVCVKIWTAKDFQLRQYFIAPLSQWFGMFMLFKLVMHIKVESIVSGYINCNMNPHKQPEKSLLHYS